MLEWYATHLIVTCPHCGRCNEYHDGYAPEDVPKDGDLSLCWGCRQFAVYINGSLGMDAP